MSLLSLHSLLLSVLFLSQVHGNFLQDLASNIRVKTTSFERNKHRPQSDSEILKELGQLHLSDCLKSEEKEQSPECRQQLKATFQTDSPIIGVLSQPLQGGGRYSSYIETSCVKFLQGAGARVVMVDYKNSRSTMKRALENLDGIYIPGDSISVTTSSKYRKAVENILEWAIDVNLDTGSSHVHFPVMAFSYGSAVVLQAMGRTTRLLSNMPAILQGTSNNLTLVARTPQDTLLYHSKSSEELDEIFDNITVYTLTTQGINKQSFENDRQLRKYFVTTVTFDQEDVDEKYQYVACYEGINIPFLGCAFSPEKTLYNYDPALEEKIDFRYDCIAHSQFVANFLVDQAKLSTNEFSIREEQSQLINNYDPEITKMVVEDGSSQEAYIYRFE